MNIINYLKKQNKAHNFSRFRRRSPEALEAQRQEEIEKLKQMLDEYRERIKSEEAQEKK